MSLYHTNRSLFTTNQNKLANQASTLVSDVVTPTTTTRQPVAVSIARIAQFDVTEFMQGRVDLAGGRFLFLSKTEPLTDLFGDPCPGRNKCLVLHYEILGTEGKAEALESDHRLLTPISISCT